MRDLVHRQAMSSSIGPATVTATTNGSGVDTLGYDAVILYFQAATMTGTTPSYTPKVQTSADNGSTDPYVDLDATAYIGGVAPAALTAAGALMAGLMVATSQTAGAVSPRRWLRAVLTVSGTTPSAIVVVLFVLGYPRHSGAPV